MVDQFQKADLGFVQVSIGILEVLKAALWPAAVLIIFSFLYSPITTVLNELPSAIGRADVISIGEFKVQMNKALENNATGEVRDALRDMKSQQAARLLRLNVLNVVCDFRIAPRERFADEQKIDNELAALRLVTITPRPNDNDQQKSNCYGVETNGLGKRTQDFLIQFLTTSLRLGPK